MSRRMIVLAALAGLTLSPTLLPAQEQPREEQRGDRGDRERDERGDRGDRGDRGRFDPAQFRERYMNQLKESMAATDEEWGVIQPKLDKVMAARRETGGMAFGGGMFGGRGPRGGDDNRQRSAVETASRELRELLENKEAPADQIQAKLTALREAREKARANLQATQKELKDVLSQRQEAVLVTSGILE